MTQDIGRNGKNQKNLTAFLQTSYWKRLRLNKYIFFINNRLKFLLLKTTNFLFKKIYNFDLQKRGNPLFCCQFHSIEGGFVFE